MWYDIDVARASFAAQFCWSIREEKGDVCISLTTKLMGCGFWFLQMLNSIGLLALAPDIVDRMWFGSIPKPAKRT